MYYSTEHPLYQGFVRGWTWFALTVIKKVEGQIKLTQISQTDMNLNKTAAML